jgi:hypothetical protein
VAFRQYRRTRSGIDAGVHAVLYYLAIVTAPVWIPVVLVMVLYQACVTNSPQAQAERARAEAARQAQQVEEQRRVQAAADAAAHAPWDQLRCEALIVRLDRDVRSARSGSDSAAVEAATLRQQASDHGCKRSGRSGASGERPNAGRF